MSIYSKNSPPSYYYIYAYLNNDNIPYYIGKGSNKRAWMPHKKNGINILPKDSNKIVIMEANLTEIGAFALERRYIQWYGRIVNNTGILINVSKGGPSGYSYKGRKNRLGKPNKNPHPSKGKTYEEIFGTNRADHIKNKLKNIANTPDRIIECVEAGKKGWLKKGKWTEEEIQKRIKTRKEMGTFNKDMSACHTKEAIEKRNITRKIKGVKYNKECRLNLQRPDVAWKREKKKILNAIQRIIEYYKQPFTNELLKKARKERRSSLTETSVNKYITEKDILRFPYVEQPTK